MVPKLSQIVPNDVPNLVHLCADDSEDFDSWLRHFLLKSAEGKLSGFILSIAYIFDGLMVQKRSTESINIT